MKHLRRWLMIFISVLLLIAGLLTFPLPIPIGLPIFLIGLALLIRHSSAAKRKLIKLGARYPKLGKALKQTIRRKPAKKEKTPTE